ncbi:hypothetical protein SDRG_08478 [Saprolegnia diclina VS20]|uniref:Peptidase S1 domain-containing protein n=1 Tax=Saprolegnia diclina (strain VS20) TaxID=1156394 RepID=T0QJ70_SAPDV|nr:hypothetical protein SDRG_08478 [Saprolegnia diclina VS20]EQC33795.1 hypothetical protein SDRG_08478 [Saprolegnia diclina VS20]|eukprot:XP_008612590.1 hypothetical protein SDRG_08478 [Saprolegnia diclina VS20]
MVHIASFALLASAALAAPTSYIKGRHGATHTEAIEVIGGNEAEVGKHLYVTGLRQTEIKKNECGGSLISPTAVLTTAQCAYGDWAQYVSVGSHFLNGTSDGERIKVKTIVSHPKFNMETMVYDYAILELENPSKVLPIEVSFEDDAANAPGVTGVARGWGTTSLMSPQSNVLKEVGLKIWSNKDCQAAFTKLNDPSIPAVATSMVCAGGVKGEDTCQGDMGGPLTVTKNGKDVLVGLTSWGVVCGEAGIPSVYARLSQAKDFIAPYLPKPAC